MNFPTLTGQSSNSNSLLTEVGLLTYRGLTYLMPQTILSDRNLSVNHEEVHRQVVFLIGDMCD